MSGSVRKTDPTPISYIFNTDYRMALNVSTLNQKSHFKAGYITENVYKAAIVQRAALIHVCRKSTTKQNSRDTLFDLERVNQARKPEQEPSSSLSVACVHVHKHRTFNNRGNGVYELCSGMEFHIHKHLSLYTYIKMACQL